MHALSAMFSIKVQADFNCLQQLTPITAAYNFVSVVLNLVMKQNDPISFRQIVWVQFILHDVLCTFCERKRKHKYEHITKI